MNDVGDNLDVHALGNLVRNADLEFGLRSVEEDSSRVLLALGRPILAKLGLDLDIGIFESVDIDRLFKISRDGKDFHLALGIGFQQVCLNLAIAIESQRAGLGWRMSFVECLEPDSPLERDVRRRKRNWGHRPGIVPAAICTVGGPVRGGGANK